jgi:hypothetical protein
MADEAHLHALDTVDEGDSVGAADELWFERQPLIRFDGRVYVSSDTLLVLVELDGGLVRWSPGVEAKGQGHRLQIRAKGFTLSTETGPPIVGKR